MPRVLPARSSPMDSCQPPWRTEAVSSIKWRALARISAHVSSTVGDETYEVGRWRCRGRPPPPRRSRHCAWRWKRISFRYRSRSMMGALRGVRSRMNAHDIERQQTPDDCVGVGEVDRGTQRPRRVSRRPTNRRAAARLLGNRRVRRFSSSLALDLAHGQARTHHEPHGFVRPPPALLLSLTCRKERTPRRRCRLRSARVRTPGMAAAPENPDACRRR